MTKYKLVPAEPTPVAWVTADTVDGQAANGKPRRIWWENNEGVGMPIYAAPLPEPEVAKLVEALELFMINPTPTGEDFDKARAAIAAYRNQGGDL